MRKILDIQVGEKFGDLICIGVCHKRLDNGQTSNFYTMKCEKCGRKKDMLSSTIRNQDGITHKACGRGLRTANPIFYQRWKAMRTRTCNPHYEHSECYMGQNIDSNDFEYFIDFYDIMYESFQELADKIGPQNTSLERIDVTKGYTAENCIWIHKCEQPKNTRRIITFNVIFPDGHMERHKNVNQFARDHDLNASTILDVLNPNRSTKQHKGYRFQRVS